MIRELADYQEAFYRGLDDFETFGNGWLARVEKRLDAALKMVV